MDLIQDTNRDYALCQLESANGYLGECEEPFYIPYAAWLVAQLNPATFGIVAFFFWGVTNETIYYWKGVWRQKRLYFAPSLSAMLPSHGSQSTNPRLNSTSSGGESVEMGNFENGAPA
jgi:hypothetical protein